MPGHEICPYLSRKPRASQCRSDQVSSRCPAVAITGTRPFTAQHNLEPSKSVFACSRACLHLCLVFSALCPSCLTSFSATALDLGILPRDAVFVGTGSCMSGNVVTLVLRLGFGGVTLENRLAALVDQASALHVHVGGTSNSTGLFCGRLPIYIAPSGSTHRGGTDKGNSCRRRARG